MRRFLVAVAVIVAAGSLSAVAGAQTIVSPPSAAHHHHHAKARHAGYLYVAEARLRTVQVVTKFAAHHVGVYDVGACHRRSALAVNCDVLRVFTEQDVRTVCDYVSRVRKYPHGRSYAWRTRLDVSGRGCRLA